MACSLDHENSLRKTGSKLIAGIDEAGRGPLAGPVVASAVVLAADFHHELLTDSKQLTHKQRENLYEELVSRSDILWAVSIVDSEEVDRINILRATHEAMRRAVAGLSKKPCHVLIDGLPVRPFPIPQTAIVQGDSLSFSIAAASVIAKVTRDRIMVEMDVRHPGYEFGQHKGYGTKLHIERLQKLGPCPIHRKSFAPVAQRSFSFD
jgi:ribonuclease HII